MDGLLDALKVIAPVYVFLLGAFLVFARVAAHMTSPLVIIAGFVVVVVAGVGYAVWRDVRTDDRAERDKEDTFREGLELIKQLRIEAAEQGHSPELHRKDKL
jgi:Flp pilus assembly protein TadB